MFERLSDAFGEVQQGLFEAVVQPLVFSLGLGGWLEEAFDATGWFLIGVLQILAMVLLIAPLQRWRPVEPVRDRAAIRTDMVYTAIHKLGLVRLALFLAVTPLFDAVLGTLRSAGWGTWHLDQWYPALTEQPWVSVPLYVIVLDFVGYWIHRGRHRWQWWWSLHAVHHSQRQMTMWSDDRNHLLDDLLHDAIFVLVAHLIGVPPAQFVLVLVLMQLSESLQHANLRLSFGRWGQMLWISPAFHRTHHAIGIGHERSVKPPASACAACAQNAALAGAATMPPPTECLSCARGMHARALGGCNYGVLLPWWDLLFGTANFANRYSATGIRDQVEPDARGAVRDYGQGFWAQQWRGVLRLMGRA